MEQQGKPMAPAVADTSRGARWWYYVVTIGTVGLFAWVPFLHAAIRLKTAYARLLALLFGGLDLLIYVLLALTPKDSQGHANGGTISFVGGLLAIGTIIVGCVMLASLRGPTSATATASAPLPPTVPGPNVDPAIRAALAARARREESRKLAAGDPLLARELRIGRPDLTRDYDDGGLVDLNSAPAAVIAEVCGIPGEVAAAIVDARADRTFANVEELFVVADVPVNTWDRIRDRAVLVA